MSQQSVVRNWVQRIRIGYTLACLFVAIPLSGPWERTLSAARDEASLAGAWVMAVIVLAVAAFWDNATRIRALCAHPDAWMPKIRAAIARTVLFAALIATVVALPAATLIYALTGVDPS